MAVWSYIIAELIGGEILAELPMQSVRFSRRLNKAGDFRATLPLDDRLAARGLDFYDLTTPARRAIYVLRDDQPQWGGILWTRRYDSESQSMNLQAADWWSYFDHRKVLPIISANPDTDVVAGLQTEYQQLDQNEIARRLVSLAQSHTGGDIGIQLGDTSSAITRDRTYHGYDLKTTGEALSQLSSVIDGPDIRFDVGSDSSGDITRGLLIGEPDLGQSGSPLVFEYGGNLTSYTWPSDGTGMSTRSYAVGDGLEAGTPIAVAEDTSRYAGGWPLLETETGYSSVTSSDVLTEHAEADQQAARLPVVLPTLTVRGDLPPQTGTYDPGDDARVIIRDRFHSRGLDTRMRIVDMDITPDDGGGETTVLTMAPLVEGPDIY
ncbi:hypothetical protein SAMN04487905_10616 [Actinopolyspora xinjiangensis]|uniref:Virus ReqiPepy6 Gp37-like protein n=1 Tax=Actinopolyspora xinjiangensis TaxID=405564 RepID=A0A1H0U3N0_9ACTN|nr:hypothetical protein [Actinopolyspora xinjiangensis]SDP60578.1 hypothetical protein SAMN04487905_10616 [Actinopolyspora xinjiangensis]